ncbi:hypothetical protein AX14_003369 [Amanita brunnescens Koide BX004]|nr:hypothetical protein AX14_003369 [Amanita brunnescens Koide BX004]
MQAQSSKSLGEMEEKRQADTAISKIDIGTLALCSPKSSLDVMPPACSHVLQVASTSPRHLFDEFKPSMKMVTKQQLEVYCIVDSENDGNTFPTFKSSEAIELAEVECLDNDVMIRREDASVLPPSHGEVSVMKRLPIEEKAIVNKKDSSSLKCSPIAEATLTLPARSPIASIWAASSHPLKDKSELHFPIVSSQPVNMISQSLTTSINACLIKKVGAHLPAPNVAVD